MGDAAHRVAAIYVTFHPNAAVLHDSVASIAGQVERIVVVDNASTPESRSTIRHAQGSIPDHQFVVVPMTENSGISVAFNAGLRFARSAGCDLALLLDQDSVPEPGAVKELIENFRRLSAVDRVGALQGKNVDPSGYRTQDQRLAEYYRRRGLAHDGHAREGLLLLNSGALIPISPTLLLGGFDERFFVDFADFDLGLRLRKAGLRVFEVSGAVFHHNVGSPDAPSLVRIYYAARELVRLVRAHLSSEPGVTFVVAESVVARTLSVALRSGRPMRVLSLAVEGTVDGLVGKTGERRTLVPTR